MSNKTNTNATSSKRGRPPKEIKDSGKKLDFTRQIGRPRKGIEENVRITKNSNVDEYFKNGRSVIFNDKIFDQNIEDHCILLEAIHRYYIEMETWCNTQTLKSSTNMHYWLMRILKQIKIRQLQVKQFQNSRDPRFNSEVYKIRYQEAILKDEEAIMAEIAAATKRLRDDAGFLNE